MPELSDRALNRLVEWLKQHGLTDAEIVEYIDYITK